MRVSYESNPRSVEDWLAKVRGTHLVLPRFQRMQAWSANQVRELMQSIVDGLPVGAVLLLEVGNEPQFAYRPLKGAPNKKDEPINEMLLDGQQRLTSLWRVLRDDYSRDSYLLQVRDVDGSLGEEELPLVHRVRRYERNNKMYPLWVDKPKDTYGRGMFPFYLLNPRNEAETKDWIFEATEDSDERWNLNDEIHGIREHVKKFQIPYIRLTANTPMDAVLATFTKVNTQGTPLSPYDLVVAQMEKYDFDMHRKVEELWDDVAILSSFPSLDEIDILRSLAVMEGKAPTRRQILNLDPHHLQDKWEDLEKGMRRALSFLIEEGLVHGKLLPSSAILPGLFALWADIPEGGFAEGNARTLLSRYIWWAFFSDRYERAVNTMLRQDYQALKQRLDGCVVDLPFESADVPESPAEFLDAGSPKRRDRLARAILAAAIKHGARDIHDGSTISVSNIRNREYHHLFPKAYLRKVDKDAKADRALNTALITWRTNRRIAASNPAEYLLEAADQVLGKEELRKRLESHLIPVEPFLEEDYDLFLQKRAELVFDEMEGLLSDCESTS